MLAVLRAVRFSYFSKEKRTKKKKKSEVALFVSGMTYAPTRMNPAEHWVSCRVRRVCFYC